MRKAATLTQFGLSSVHTTTEVEKDGGPKLPTSDETYAAFANGTGSPNANLWLTQDTRPGIRLLTQLRSNQKP
eukprot:3850288-Amphidinium_carterae.1